MRPAILTSFSRWRFSEEEEDALRPPLEEEDEGGVGGGRPDKKIQRLYQGKGVQIKIAPPSFVLFSISVCYTAHHLLRRRCLRRSFDPAASASCVQIKGLSFPKKSYFLLHFLAGNIPCELSCRHHLELRPLRRPRRPRPVPGGGGGAVPLKAEVDVILEKYIQRVFRVSYFLPVINLRLSNRSPFPTLISLQGGIHRLLTRFLFGVGSIALGWDLSL